MVHEFDNGVKVYNKYLSDKLLKRYEKRNIWEEEEEPIFCDIVSRLSNNAVYVNLGGATGYYSILAKKLNQRLKVHVIEPLPYFCTAIQEHIVINGFKQEDIVLHQVAVSDSSGYTYFRNLNYGSYIYELTTYQKFKLFVKKLLWGVGIRRFPFEQLIKVKKMTLSAFLDRMKTDVDLMQIDIQGFEYSVLKEYFQPHNQKKIEQFLIGTHGAKVHDQCKELLLTNGYKIVLDIPDPANQPDGILHAVLSKDPQ